jgi:hypothetical protein
MMKIRPLKKFFATFSISLIVTIGVGYACISFDDRWFGYSNFAPEPHVQKSLAPLFYSSGEMFYGIGYIDDYNNRFNNEIVTDWKGYLKNHMAVEHIEFLLFNEGSIKAVNDLYTFFTKKVKTGSLIEWEKKLNLANIETRNFVEFLYYARQLDAYAVKTFSYWDYEEQKQELVPESLLKQVLSKYQSVTEPFLKNRYWFQTMKAYFYSKSKQEGVQFFENTQQYNTQNTLYYRALSYVAGITKQAGNYSQANYLYSIVFDKCLPMRTTAAYNFRPQNEHDWKASLDLTKSNTEKIALWALLGYYSDATRSISEIYKLDKQSPYLDYLLTRFINISEEAIASIGTTPIEQYKSSVKAKLDQKGLNLVNSIAQEGNTAKPYLWNMAAGYLQTLNGNHAQAKTFFDKAATQIPARQEYSYQLRLLRFVNILSETIKMDSRSENLLLPDLNWVYNELPKKTPENFRYERARDWSKKYISALFKAQNNPVLAELFHPGDEFYLKNENQEAMKQFMEKQTKSAFENLAIGLYPVSLADIYEYQAVIATFENQVDQAFELMKKAGANGQIVLKANPFNGFIKDCHDCEHAMPQKTKYNKLRFVEILQIMQGKIKKGEELYNNYLLLGNAFYNMTFYGNARVFYEGNIMGEGMGTLFGVHDKHKNYLLDMKNARFYYQKAFEAATNDEQRARCCYLLAKCERNEYYNANEMTGGYWRSDDYADFLAWDGFKKLKSRYSNTKYYKEVIVECEYFAKFVGNN